MKNAAISALETQITSSLPPCADWAEFLRSGARNTYLADAGGVLLALDLDIGNKDLLNLSDVDLKALCWLNLSENKGLKTLQLPSSMPELLHLDASQCALETLELPADAFSKPFFGDPPRTVPSLYLQKNKLQSIHFKGRCAGLEMLDLSHNALSDFSLPVGFERLAYLYLNENQLQNLAFSEDLPELNILNLKGNQLEKLPELKSDTGIFAKLETLYLKGNPLKYEESLINGDKSGNALEIIGLLRAAAKSGTRPNYRARLIVVGNGRCGKTELVQRLLGEPFNGKIPFTHGISIEHLYEKNLPKLNTPEMDLQVWDFGGQDVYFATHQFFLSEEAAYLYAWTDQAIAQKNKENDTIPSPAMYSEKWRDHDYWLDTIRTHGQKSPVLIVKTHCLASKKVLPFDKLRADYSLTHEPLDFDAESTEARFLENLQDELTKLVEKLPLWGNDIPNSYDRVIEEIRRLKAEENKEELSKTGFSELVQKFPFNIPDSGIESLLGYLEKTGEIIYFSQSGALKERIFIDPQALINKVYKLLENNDYLKDKEGKFGSDYARGILGFADFDVLMELMVNFQLVYKKKDTNTYIAPQYLPELPASERDSFDFHKIEETRRFLLRYPRLLPENVMINVLSKYGPYSREKVYRTGIRFIKEGTDEECVIECAEQDQSTISVYTNENEAADRVAKEVFEQFIALSKKATIHLSLDGKEWVDVRVAKEAIEKGKNIPLIEDGGWVTKEEAWSFLFTERNFELLDKQKGPDQEDTIKAPIKPNPTLKQITPMTFSTRDIIVVGIIAIILLGMLLPIFKDGKGGKITLFKVVEIEIFGSNEASITEKVPNVPQLTTEKVSVIGRISINNREATRQQIREVSIKNNNLVNKETLSGDQFTLKEVDIPDDNKRVEIEFTFEPDGFKDSRVFNVSKIKDRICDIGEIRIFIDQPPKKGSRKNSTPVYTINNTNIIQTQTQSPGAIMSNNNPDTLKK